MPSMEGPPLRGEEPSDQARRRITDVVNRSGAEMDTPQGEAKPESNGHGCWVRDSTHALTIRPTNGRLLFMAKRFEPPNSLGRGFQRRYKGLRY